MVDLLAVLGGRLWLGGLAWVGWDGDDCHGLDLNNLGERRHGVLTKWGDGLVTSLSWRVGWYLLSRRYWVVASLSRALNEALSRCFGFARSWSRILSRYARIVV